MLRELTLMSELGINTYRCFELLDGLVVESFSEVKDPEVVQRTGITTIHPFGKTAQDIVFVLRAC